VWTATQLGVGWAAGGIFVATGYATATPQGATTIDADGERPSLVWDGTRYAVAYERDGNVYFAATCP
jgi:hypothetical protein